MATRTSLRRATAADLPAVARLLGERDGQALRTRDVSAALCGLDDRLAVMWIATVGDEAAASTAAYLREVHVRGQSEPLPIGYWAHLFVLPEHRKLMLYPQLVFMMRRAMAELGIEAIITAMRRPEVTEGHLKLGFQAMCSWPVLLKPLRPFALLGKHKSVRAASLIAPLGDRLWRAGQSLRHRGGAAEIEALAAEEVRGDPALLEQIAALLNGCRGSRLGTAWTVEILRARLGGGVDGQPYTVLLDREGGSLRGIAICRIATRGHDIKTGVVLELAGADGRSRGMRALSLACEQVLHDQGAEALLWLDGAGSETSQALRRLGYREAPGETYRLIAYTTDKGEGLLERDAAAWRFTFLDHDAF